MPNLYAAYFDESGTNPESRAMGVAGFISDALNWERFSEEWKESMINFGLNDNPGYFHMTDFESPFAAPYKDWPRYRRYELLDRLLDLIAKYAFSSVACLIQKGSFESIMHPFSKAICGGPYGLAAMDCFLRLEPTLIDVDGQIEYSFEDGATGKGELLNVYDRQKAYGRRNQSKLRMVSLVFRDKRLYPPLQAADILIYELVKEFPRQMEWEKRFPVRYPLKRLSKGLHQWHYLDDEQLWAWNRALLDPTVI